MADLAVGLDRSSPIPLYFQMAQQIERAIESGALAPGDRLDNEVRLADQYGLSRPTMRRAIQELVGKGLLVRRRGVGTQVVHGRVNRQMELTSLYDDLLRAGAQPSTQVLEHVTMPAPPRVATELGIAEGEPVLHVVRLRRTADGPLAVLRNWLPAEFASIMPDALERDGLYRLLRARGVQPRVATQGLSAKAATPAEAKLLSVRRGSPLLAMTRTLYDETGRAIEHGDHVYVGESYSVEVTVVAR
jgi:DNA-binding GntR family transcriptional regulator